MQQIIKDQRFINRMTFKRLTRLTNQNKGKQKNSENDSKIQ